MTLQITANPRRQNAFGITANTRRAASVGSRINWESLFNIPANIEFLAENVADVNEYPHTDAGGNWQYSTVSPFSRTVLDDATANAWLTTITATRVETGAAAVSLLDKTRQIISPADFGAVGDGTTDDTTALQNMANAACLVGAHVIFPAYKNYKITSEIEWKPQVSDGYAGPYATPSDILFIEKRPVLISGNGSKITAAASMTNMFEFVFSGSWVAPFFSEVNGLVFNGASLATNSVNSNYCLGLRVVRNRIYGVTNGIKFTGYGTHYIAHNHIRATKCFDLTDGGADSLYEFNDLYPSSAGFYLTAATGGQLRIFSNAATNEAGGTAYFVQADSSANSNTLRNVAVIGNGIAGFNALVYARGNSSSFNNKYWQVTDNNALDYGAKTTIGLIDTTETDGWEVRGNTFNAVSVTATQKTILMTNDARSSVIDNHIHDADEAAIHIAFGNRTNVAGNRLHNVGSATNTKAIRVTNGSSRVRVVHNVIDQDSSSYAQNGIVEEDTSDNNVLSDNTVNNVSTPYTVVGASTLSGNVTSVGMAVYKAANAAAARTAIGTVIGTDVQAYDADLAALAANSTDGLWAHTGAGTGAARTLTAPAAGLTISNPAGIAGNPTFALADDLAALEALSGTNTIYYRSAASTWTAVTISTGISFSGGNLGIDTAVVPRLNVANVFTDSTAFPFTQTGTHASGVNIGVKHLPSGNGTSSDVINYTFNFKDDGGTEYNAMNWIVQQDDAAAASRDSSLTLQTVVAGTLGQRFKLGGGLAVGPFGTADPGPGSINASASVKAHSGTAIPAGGTAGAGLLVSSTSNFGVFFGSGVPTLSAAKGSLYLRSDGSSTSTRMYVNTDGGTTWTSVTTAA